MRKKLLVSAGALAITVAMNGPLTAADYPVKSPPAAAASVFNWSGFYIGGHLGYGSSGFQNNSELALGTRRGKGLVGGLQAGYNIQNGNIVWGIEGDLSAAGLNTHLSDNSYTTDLLASVRGR